MLPRKTAAHHPGARPTLRLIAREAGVSLTAVSMALRNHPEISARTRARVQSVARKLGYHPDPKLSALMRHLRTQHDGVYRETLAYLSSYPSYESWKSLPHHDYYLGAAVRAQELGYRLDVCHLAAPGMTLRRISRLLEARGIRGLLIGGFERPGFVLSLDWKRFAATAFDYSLGSPALHRVTTNYYLDMLSVLRRLEGEGYRRVGLNANGDDDAKVLGLWQAAYLYFESRLPRDRRVPVNITPGGKSRLQTWLTRHRPDAIVSAGHCDFSSDYRRLHGRPVPGRIGCVNMNIAYTDGSSRGIDKLSYQVGQLACEHLVAQLQRNEVGLPTHPQTISIDGVWVEDHSAWKQNVEATRAAAFQRLAGRSF